MATSEFGANHIPEKFEHFNALFGLGIWPAYVAIYVTGHFRVGEVCDRGGEFDDASSHHSSDHDNDFRVSRLLEGLIGVYHFGVGAHDAEFVLTCCGLRCQVAKKSLRIAMAAL